jgi:hypothetical protein
MRAGCNERDRGLLFYQAGQPVSFAGDCDQVGFPEQNDAEGRIAIHAPSIFACCLTDVASGDYHRDAVARPLSYSDLRRGVIQAQRAGVLAANVPC